MAGKSGDARHIRKVAAMTTACQLSITKGIVMVSSPYLALGSRHFDIFKPN
jgi:hypothetical protein